MKILSFDTSNNLASVAIINGSEILAYNITKQSSQQAEKLFQLIDESLSHANLNLNDLDLVSITNGPGSFTGVRIALAAALGMELGCKAPFIALSNFQALAWHARESHPNKKIAVILDARRDQVYFQLFSPILEALTAPKLLSIEDLLKSIDDDMILIGDGIKFLQHQPISFKIEADIIVNAEILAKSSEFYWQKNDYHGLIPLYIRQPDAC